MPAEYRLFMENKMLSRKIRDLWPGRFGIAVTASILIAGLAVVSAAAHTRVEFGPYTLVLGWENEPVIVGERNALLIHIAEGQTPVEGMEGLLSLTVFYGGESFIGQIAPTDQPGVYKAEIFPTLRGQYEVQITGEIEGFAIDAILEPEEVLPADILQFPEVLPDTAEMQMEIDQLKGTVTTTRSIAFAGLAAGLVGTALAASLGFGRRNQKTS